MNNKLYDKQDKIRYLAHDFLYNLDYVKFEEIDKLDYSARKNNRYPSWKIIKSKDNSNLKKTKEVFNLIDDVYNEACDFHDNILDFNFIHSKLGEKVLKDIMNDFNTIVDMFSVIENDTSLFEWVGHDLIIKTEVSQEYKIKTYTMMKDTLHKINIFILDMIKRYEKYKMDLIYSKFNSDKYKTKTGKFNY